jgi:tRNA U34 2-thiouridine synthase MnmA/TrmU
MSNETKKTHAIALFSGGLDSSLAILLMLKQNVEVTALMFLNHFGCEIGDRSSCGSDPYPTAEKFGFTVKLMHLGEKFIDLVQNPRHGYGKNMNPCTDCRILMLHEAKQYMEMVGADLIITGEVLAQRPMSQMRNSLNLILKESQLEGRLLRPLSAKLMEPTIPEQEGLIDREQLKDISGRSRKRQIELAEEFGMHDYPSPAAGCLLTDRGYSIKLRDLLEHKAKVDFDDINLLKTGRHFRLSPTCKLIVGRREEENEKLQPFAAKHTALEVREHGSPLALLVGEYGEHELEIAAALTARYSDGRHLDRVEVEVQRNGTTDSISVAPLTPEQIEPYRMIWKKRPQNGRYEWSTGSGSAD